MALDHTADQPQRYLSVNELCRRYGISRTSFYRMRATPELGLAEILVRIPPPNGRIRVPLGAFEAWLRRRRTPRRGLGLRGASSAA